MLEFDLNHSPPTGEQIATEQDRLKLSKLKAKRQTWLGLSAILYVSILAILSLLRIWAWPPEISDMAMTSVAIVVVGVAVVVSVTARFGISAAPPASSVFPIAFFSSIMMVAAMIIAAIATNVELPSFVAGDVLFYSVLGVLIVAGHASGAFAIAQTKRLSTLNDRLDDLESLNKPEFRHQCRQFIVDCLAELSCESYRQLLAISGRHPVMAEVKMVRKWVDGLAARRDKEEQQRRLEIACALVGNSEPLTEQALPLINAH